MRLSVLFLGISLSLAVQASWFSASEPEPVYSEWSTSELKNWLELHSVPLPSHTLSQAELRSLVADNWSTASTWTYDQYNNAQKAFQDLRASSFDSWDESKLREWLLQQGVVAPKSNREKLVLMAKEKYRSYTDAASSYQSKASATASTMLYGDATYQMSKSLSGAAAQASDAAGQVTRGVARSFDETKDYVYSTWDDNQLQRYLEGKGLLKTKAQKRRDELLAMMHNAYGKVTDPVWEAWSDSYINHWLVSHNIIKSDAEKNRQHLRQQMQKYYYSTSDSVFNSWTDSQLRQWLIDHSIIKSDAEVSRSKMVKMIENNYLSAKDTFWHSWTDNQIQDWLIEHGYLRSDAQVKRDQLVKLADEKYHDASAKTSAYLTWPDARLRAYLREHGVSEDKVPGSRPGLLQECRIRWVQTETRAENLLAKIRELVNDGVYKVEDVLSQILNLLTYGWVDVKDRSHHAQRAGSAQYENAKEKAEKGYYDAKKAGEKGYYDAKKEAGGSGDWAEEKWEEARHNAGEKVKVSGEKIKGEL